MKIQYGRLARTSNTHTISFPISLLQHDILLQERKKDQVKHNMIVLLQQEKQQIFSTYCEMKTDEKKNSNIVDEYWILIMESLYVGETLVE